MIKIKTALIIFAIVIAIFVLMIIYLKWNYKSQITEISSQIKELEKQHITKIDSLSKNQAIEIRNLIDQNEKAKQESQYWYNQAKAASINPNYDFDFITAAGILSRSEYKPGQ